MKIAKIKKSKPTIIGVIAIILFACTGLYTIYAFQSKSWPFLNSSSSDNKPLQQENEGINYSPPTKEEVDNSQNAKKNTPPDSQQETKNTQSKRTVSVSLSFADVINGKLEIRAFTTDVIEGSGVCTAKLQKSGQLDVILNSEAFIDSTSSICKVISVDASTLISGDWQLKVSYSSPTSIGESESIKVVVP